MKNRTPHSILLLLDLAVLFALLDLGTRELTRNFEWFEFHLAVISPLVFFFLPALLLVLLCRCLARSFTERFFTVVGSGAILLLLLSFSFGQILRDGAALPQYAIAPSTLLILLLLTLFDLALHARDKPSVGKAIASLHRKAEPALSVLRQLILLMTFFSLVFDFRFPQKAQVCESAETDKPNLLLIVLDTVRFDSYAPHAEALRDILGSDKTRLMSDVRSPSPWTLPAHASLFTGLYADKHGASLRYQKLDEEHVTLAEVLKEQGYSTGLFTGNAYLKRKFGMAQGFETVHDRIDFFEQKFTSEVFSYRLLLQFISKGFEDFLYRTDGERPAADVLEDTKGFICSQGDKPFFAFVNLFDAHDPYLPRSYPDGLTEDDGKRLFRRFKQLSDWRRSYKVKSIPADLSQDELLQMRQLYEQEVLELSETVNQFLLHLQQSGHLSNTLVMITSDHGEEFLEHGGIGHAAVLYDESIRVPFVLYDFDAAKQYDTERASSLVDVFTTVLERLALPAAESDGTSWLSEAPGTLTVKAALSGRENFREPLEHTAVVSKGLKTLRSNPPKERIKTGVYNLSEDPKELNPQTEDSSQESLQPLE